MTTQEAGKRLGRILAYEARASALAARIEQNAKQSLEILRANLEEAREICARLRAKMETG